MRREDGQALVLCCLFLGALLAMASLAVDVGNLYLVRASFQRAADAAALAGGTGLAVSQAQATSLAIQFAGLNLSAQPGPSGTTTSVTFPTANTIRVSISNQSVGLFFGGIIGRPTAPVAADATAILGPVASVTGDLVPLAVYCNSQTDCEGVLAVGQTHTLRRYCGNFFLSGPSGSACGNSDDDDDIGPGEVFLQGVTFTGESNSNAVFRAEVYDGYAGTLAIGDEVGQLLPGNRNGWRRGMTMRLAEGRNEMTLPIIRPADGSGAIEIIDFIKVRVTDFSITGNTDSLTFEIIQAVTSATSFATGSQGYGINSVVGVRLID